MARCLTSVLVFLVFSPLLPAQVTPARDNNQLIVRVRTGDERSIEMPIRVEVLGSQGVVASVDVTGGEAQFSVTSGRTYRLTVSGSGFEPVTTGYFEINTLEKEHTEVVTLKPENRKSAGESPPGSPTISVSEMNTPKKARTEMTRGLDAYSKGNLESAAAHFEKALAEYPRYARAYDMLGVIAIKRVDRTKAKDLFSKSIQVDGTFVPAYVDLARMDLQDQDYAAAESLLAKAIDVNPSVPDAVALLATTEFANKQYDKALSDVQRTHALRNHEKFAEVHIMAGKVLTMQNHSEEAIAQFQLFLIEKPDSPQTNSVREAIVSLKAGKQR